MNPRRVHHLIRTHFASAGSANVNWHNLVDENGLLINDRVQAVVLGHFLEQGIEEVLIEARRKTGCLVPVTDVIPYLRGQVGRGSSIRLANREFTVFGEVAMNGVGRSWRKP